MPFPASPCSSSGSHIPFSRNRDTVYFLPILSFEALHVSLSYVQRRKFLSSGNVCHGEFFNNIQKEDFMTVSAEESGLEHKTISLVSLRILQLSVAANH